MSNCLNYPLIPSALEQLVVNVYIIIKLFVKSFKQALGTPNIVKTKHVCTNRVHDLNKGINWVQTCFWIKTQSQMSLVPNLQVFVP